MQAVKYAHMSFSWFITTETRNEINILLKLGYARKHIIDYFFDSTDLIFEPGEDDPITIFEQTNGEVKIKAKTSITYYQAEEGEIRVLFLCYFEEPIRTNNYRNFQNWTQPKKHKPYRIRLVTYDTTPLSFEELVKQLSTIKNV